jgi:hypothetical protein
MNSDDLATRVETLCSRDAEAFDARVREEAVWLREAISSGQFDSDVPTVGLEYEWYGVDTDGALVTLSPDADALPGGETEVGRHQFELQVSPQPLSAAGFETVETELRARFEAASDHLLDAGARLVSDGMWTIPPAEESSLEYLTDSEATEGGPLATNMVDSARYHAQSRAAATNLDAPHVSYDGETVLLNSLTTSIQPHFCVPEAAALPEYFRYALRVAGPLLALGVNSPFFPPELYDDDASAEAILADGRMENRIGVFESVMNAETGQRKVRFPDDVASIDEAVSSVVDDPTVLPLAPDPDDPDDLDQLTNFEHKHGCYWRWVRPVFDARDDGGSNVRIEFRPIPGQPTLADSVAFFGLVAGLLTDLPRRDHPVASLEWGDARDNFYAAAADGLDAELAWIDRDGTPVTSTDAVFTDLFTCAHAGLETAGFDAEEATSVLEPLRTRVDDRRTPAGWKREQVRERLDAGDSLETAIRGTQRAYIHEQAATFEDGRFDAWGSPREGTPGLGQESG